MYKLFISLLLISLAALCYSDESVLDGTELELTFLVHRHGDRTPVESTLSQSTDVEDLIEASAKYGYGQLTDVGRRRSYALGQFIRRRYDALLSPNYNRSEIYIRSTDSTRTKMTVLSAMAAVYPVSEDNWSDTINWTPIPYTTVPAKYDFNLATTNCPNLLASLTSVDNLSQPFPSLDQYADILNIWSEIAGLNISAMPFLAYTLNDVYTAQMNLGIPLDPALQEIYPEIEEIAGIAMDYIFGNQNLIALHSGVLLNKFFAVADQVIAGEDVPRVQIYSAHDINVFTFQVVTQISPRQGVPKYASAYALELRRVVATGEYVVVCYSKLNACRQWHPTDFDACSRHATYYQDGFADHLECLQGPLVVRGPPVKNHCTRPTGPPICHSTHINSEMDSNLIDSSHLVFFE